MTTHVANISYLTDIRFGAGALQCLPDVMDTLSMTRPLVVTDAVLRDVGYSAEEIAGLRADGAIGPEYAA